MNWLKHMALALAVLVPFGASAEARLYMAEEPGCIYCAQWNNEIAPIYPKTSEGKAAPLHRFDLRGTRPENVTFARPLTFTPTFVLVDNGEEIGRIEGYPGEDFFWGLLGMLFDQADIELEPTG